MTIEIQNLTKSAINEDLTKKIINTTLHCEKINDNIEISVVFVGSGRMQKLNKKYRKKNRATDVLSFRGSLDFICPEDAGKYLGEIVVCLREVKKQAMRAKKSFKQEFAHVLIHGVLHLVGYEHDENAEALEKMHAREKKIISLVYEL